MEAVHGVPRRNRRPRNHHPGLPLFVAQYDTQSSSVEEALERIRYGKRQRDQFCPVLSQEASKKRRLSRINKRRQQRLVAAGLAASVVSSVSRDVIPPEYAEALKATHPGRCYVGRPDYKCQYCGAVFWYHERVKSESAFTRRRVIYNMCCKGGKVQLPSFTPPPPFLSELLKFDGGSRSRAFLQKIRHYNSLFAFTSMGASIDRSVNNGSGPPVFRISGQICHRIGSLLPGAGDQPKFAQLYIYDTSNELANRLEAIQSGGTKDDDALVLCHTYQKLTTCPGFMPQPRRPILMQLLLAHPIHSEITTSPSLQSCCFSHTPHAVQFVPCDSFYWKVATEADLGFAYAYINGYISFVDNREGLLNILLIILANRGERKRLRNSARKSSYLRKGWWTPLVGITGVAFAKYVLRHPSRKNSVSKAAKNISKHYDLSNDFFALFLDSSMTYSCAIFKAEEESLEAAQLRKTDILIKKAKVESGHHVLEIGSGWGTLGIQLVKKTGCKYTGITLSEEQLKYTKRKVKEAGLEDNITFLLCDYRQIPTCHKFDRIISCEMIEHVGHEYMDNFFGCCEDHLAEHGLLVLQFSAFPEELYDKMRRRPDFMKEYIFPGGCLPSLGRIVPAMSNASRLCIQHLENIGDHPDSDALEG